MCRQGFNGTDVPFPFILLPVLSRHRMLINIRDCHSVCTSDVALAAARRKLQRTLTAGRCRGWPQIVWTGGDTFSTPWSPIGPHVIGRGIVESNATWTPKWFGVTSSSAAVRQKSSAAARTALARRGQYRGFVRVSDRAIALLPPIPCSLTAFVRGIGGLSAILADDFLVALEPELRRCGADENVIAAPIPFCHTISTEPSSEPIRERLCTVVGRGVVARHVRVYVGLVAHSGAYRCVRLGRVRRKSSVIS